MFARLLLGGVLGMALGTFSSGANAVSGGGPLFSGADRNGGLFTVAKVQMIDDRNNEHEGGAIPSPSRAPHQLLTLEHDERQHNHEHQHEGGNDHDHDPQSGH